MAHLIINEQLLSDLQRVYPQLRRAELLHAVVRAGPVSSRIHEELARLCAEVQALRVTPGGARGAARAETA